MGLRLLRWWHRDAVPAGRHVRALPLVTMPGAAATIVGSASLDPLVTGAGAAWAPVVEPASVPGSTVGLVFADGDSVELDPDDPRVRTFRAAAEALLDHSAR
jgi:hypothetical protein